MLRKGKAWLGHRTGALVSTEGCRDCGGEECSRPCQLCENHLGIELRTCLICAAAVRKNLHRVTRLYRALPAFVPKLAVQRLDQRRGSNEPSLPGGDHLVFLADGSDAGNRRRAFLAGLDESWDQDDRLSDPLSVAYFLASWEDEFRRQRREPAASDRATVATAATYLQHRHDWAAQHHPEFPVYADQLDRLRKHLERITYTSDAPEPVNAYCTVPGCGQRLLRKLNEETGFDDNAYCPSRTCRRVYEPRELAFAYRAWMEERVAEREAS